MSYLYEIALIFFQPMSYSNLLDLLDYMQITRAEYVVTIIYAFLAFLLFVMLRYFSVQARWSLMGYDRPGGIMTLIGLGLGGLSLVVMWPSLQEHLAQAVGGSYQTWLGPFPSLEVFHRAIMPLDIKGLSILRPEQMMADLYTAFLLWHENIRGAFVYPILFILCITPWLRRLTAPLVLGFVASYTVPAVLVSFMAVGIIPFWIAMTFIFTACGGFSITRAWILKEE
jgi:hypothetical protein